MLLKHYIQKVRGELFIMKQTKKFTRGQREYLQKHHVNIEGCRLVLETKDYIDFQKPSGEVERFWKGGKRICQY